jgi:hypothetical protein
MLIHLNALIMSSKSKELGKAPREKMAKPFFLLVLELAIAWKFHAKTTAQADRTADINCCTMSVGDRLSNRQAQT